MTTLSLRPARLACLVALAVVFISAASAPKTRRVDQVDVYHGVAVADPYRWLEDLASPETLAWIAAQDAASGARLEGDPSFDSLTARLLELTATEAVGVPVVRGGRAFFLHTAAGKSRPSLLMEDAGREHRVLIDGDAPPLAPDRTLAGFWPSPDGKRVAFGAGAASSRWFRLRIVDLDSGRELGDDLAGLHSGTGPVAWSADGRTIFYGRYAEPPVGREVEAVRENHRVYAHRLGTAQSDDLLIYERPDERQWSYAPLVTDDGRYLVLTVSAGSSPRTRIYLIDLVGERKDVVKLFDQGEAAYRFLTNRGTTFWFQTTRDAPRGRVVSFDLGRPDGAAWRDVIPQGEDALYFTNVVADRLITVYLQDARHVVKLFDLDGRPAGEAALPDLGTTFTGFLGRRDDAHAYYSFNSLAYPGTASVFRFDPRTGASTPFRRPKLPFDPASFVTRQVFFQSKDGTRVPMFIAHRKGLTPKPETPAYLYAYGSFGWPATPWYQPQILAWMEMGGLYALANVRGGGEYGQAWHDAGILEHRQNAIDDFVAAAEWLQANRLTSAQKLSINGGSASAPLAAAALAQRPELFGAVTIDHPILDLVRFDRFTGGARWQSEFGSVEDPAQFRRLLASSPLHNLRSGACYPPTLVTASDRDETAVPAHAYKFTAELQFAQGCDRPILLQVVRGAGHTSFGTTPEQAARMYARQLVFLRQALNVGGVSWGRTSTSMVPSDEDSTATTPLRAVHAAIPNRESHDQECGSGTDRRLNATIAVRAGTSSLSPVVEPLPRSRCAPSFRSRRP